MKSTQFRSSAIAIALAALSQGVFAQGVSIYGLVDLGIAKLSGKPVEMTNYRTSRLGFKGGEDLGGGLKAQFQLEAEVMADSGNTAAAFWERQSWVGLADDKWGAVRLGQTRSLYDDLSDHIDPFANDGIVGNFNKKAWRVDVAKSRVSNAIQYASPKWYGLRVRGQLSLSEIDGGHNGTGLSVVYENGGITAIAALDRPVVTKVGDPQPSAWLIGGRYQTGPFTFGLSHNQGDSHDKTAVKGATAEESKGDTAGFEWAYGAGVVKASYARLDTNVKDKSSVKVLGLGYEYALSKRTTLYTAVVKEDVSDVSGFSAGITHRF